MTEPAVETRVCRFPDCNHSVAAPQGGTGRPPEYCDDDAHTPAAAWRARQRARRVIAGLQAVADEDAPVTAALRVRGEAAMGIAVDVASLTALLDRIAEAQATLADPEAAAAQMDAVEVAAAERVAAAAARASRAEQAQRRAETERAEADAAAAESAAAAEQQAVDLSQVTSELTALVDTHATTVSEMEQFRAEADARHTAAQSEIASLGQELVETRRLLAETAGERDDERARVEAASMARDDAVAAAHDSAVLAEAESSRAFRAEAELARVRDAIEVERAAAGELRAAVAALTAERDGARGLAERAETAADAVRAQRDAERTVTVDLRIAASTAVAERDAARAEVKRVERAAGERVVDLRDSHNGELVRLREDLAAARAAVAK